MLRIYVGILIGLTIALSGCGTGAQDTLRWSMAAEGSAASLMLGDQILADDIRVAEVDGFATSCQNQVLTLSGRFPDTGQGPSASIVMTHQIDNPKHLWMPHLSPTDDHVMGDHSFRSPAMILADDRVAVAFIPDLDDVAAGHQSGWKTWMNYHHPERRIVFAAGNYRTEGHVFYVADPVAYTGQEVRLRVHVLASRAAADLKNPYGMAARWIWQRWGRPRHQAGGSQSAPIERYAEYIRRWAFTDSGWAETVWQEFEIDGRACGAPAFIVDVAQHPSVPIDERRWREQRSIWNQAWFSTQRCANGLLRYARQTGSEDLARRARLSTNLALAAPQTDGLFPSVYTTAPRKRRSYRSYRDIPGWDQGRWTNSDRRPSDASEDAYHLVDAAFTARLLLEWSDLAGGDPEALGYVDRFVERLLALQRDSGAFPGWLEPDGRVVPTLAEGPETAMSATLLLEVLKRKPGYAACRRAAVAALNYLEHGPVAEGRWEDFETYFSCSRWGRDDLIGKRVQRNGIYKQNTLSIFWSGEAFLAAYQVLGEQRWLDLGRRCLDELSLYQQVWDPPYIAASCHGGWGVMNGDGEWNDARQSLFAPLYLEYYRQTGEQTYFERGVAALRASFAMLYCPENEQVRRQYELRHPFFGPESYGFMMENIAHGGPAPADGSAIGPFTIYTWGNGSALAAAAKIHDRYGDVYIDTSRVRAFGIDGCEASTRGNRVLIRDRFGRDRLTVMYDDGTRRVIRMSDGRAELPLRP